MHFIGAWDPAFRAEVQEELAAQLARDGLTVAVTEDPTAPALAVLALKVDAVEVIAIEVEVHDAVTHKSSRRVADLSATKPSARSLGVAISAAELLHASWAELAFQDDADGGTPAPAPAPVVATLQRRGLRHEREAVPGAHALALAGRVQGSPGGVLLVGGDVGYELRPVPRLSVVVGLGGAGLRPIDADHGRVTGGAFVTTIGLGGALVHGSRGRLELGARIHPGLLVTRGRATPGFAGARSRNFMCDASFVVQASLRTGPVEWMLGGEVGVVLASVRIQDAGETVARYSGLRWGATLGMRVPLTRARARQEAR